MEESISKQNPDFTKEEVSGYSNLEIRALIEKNLELTKEVLVLAKKINNFIFWQRIFGVLKLFLIIIPLLIGLIYLPPLLGDVWRQWSDLMSMGQTAREFGGGMNLTDDLMNILK